MSVKDREPFTPARAWTLFTSTFMISAFTFGGGYVIVPLLKRRFCDELGWFDEEEALDLVAIAQSSPGVLATNTSIIIGYRTGGIPGALLSTFGTVLPPLIIISIIAYAYEAFAANPWVSAALSAMQGGVAAVITDVVIGMAAKQVKKRNLILILIMLAVFILSFVFNINAMFIILACIVLGVVISFLPPGFGDLKKAAVPEDKEA